jgi:hypothetical protein
MLRQRLRLLATLSLIVGFSHAAHAVSWRDDFNDGNVKDGNPLTWLDNFGGFFPGSYDASSGDYMFTPAVDGSDSSQMSAFVNVPFTDTYIRTQGKVFPDPNDPANDGGNLVLLARTDLQTISGYLMYFDVSGNLNLQILLGGATQDIGVTFDAPFNAASEVIIELNVIGDQLSGYAWAADDPNGKPALPQVTATDSTFTSGIAGIAFAEDDDNTSAIFRYVQAQDAPFVDASGGDFDNDADVDGNDFAIWQRGLGLTGQPDASTGDADGDGDVDANDVAAWAANFGPGPQAARAAGAVPEPNALILGAVAALAMVARRRSR